MSKSDDKHYDKLLSRMREVYREDNIVDYNLRKLIKSRGAEVNYFFDGDWYSGRLEKIGGRPLPDEFVALTQGRTVDEFTENLEDLMNEVEFR